MGKRCEPPQGEAKSTMRIDHLTLVNFKCFERESFTLHPECTLLVGVNGSGKTSILEALSVAVGSWFLGVDGTSTRHIRQSEVRLQAHRLGPKGEHETRWESHYPCMVAARGIVADQSLVWERSLNGKRGRTTYGGARELKSLATHICELVRREPEATLLPLVGYYGSGRLWDAPREQAQVKESDMWQDNGDTKLSRFDGYADSIDPRISVGALSRWIARQSWIGFQRGRETLLFRTVKTAMIRCIQGAKDLYFDADYGEVILEIEGQGAQPFNNLSDGQRSTLAFVGDMARKAAILNPQLGEDVLARTPGVVIVDELDLHLHPQWQRRILEDLRQTFPRVQFIATTHSPFLIQSLREREELILLGGQPPGEPPNLSLREIAQGIMGIAEPDTSRRYGEMRSVARHYLEQLEHADLSAQEKLSQFKDALAEQIAPFADNPAYQAFLEMKRVAKLGE